MTRVSRMTFWIVFDQGVRDASPDLLPSWTGARLEAAWDHHPSFARAETLEHLAHRTGIDPTGLVGSVGAYKAACVTGAPDPLWRTYRPLPLERPPFYAVRNHGTTAARWRSTDSLPC